MRKIDIDSYSTFTDRAIMISKSDCAQPQKVWACSLDIRCQSFILTAFFSRGSLLVMLSPIVARSGTPVGSLDIVWIPIKSF